MIRFQTFKPSAALAPYVREYWVMESVEPLTTERIIRLIPDGNVEWIFQLESQVAFRFGSKNSFQSSAAHFVGQFSSFVDISFPTGHFFVFAIKFHPCAAHLFWNESMHAFTEKFVSLDNTIVPEVESLEERIQCARKLEEKIRAADSFLLNRLKTPFPNELHHCFSMLQTTEEHFRVKELERTSGYTKRRLQQVFLEKVGISPKMVHRIFRMRSAVDYMKTQPAISLTQVAHEFNFYDQSHFTQEFRRFTGFTPRHFEKHLDRSTGHLTFHVPT